MKTLKEMLSLEATGLKVKNSEFYVWTRVKDGGRFIHVHRYRKGWAVYRGDKLVYGGYAGGSNTHASRNTCTTKKAAQAFVDGYINGKQLGEFPALRLSHKKGRGREEQKAYDNGVYSSMRKRL